MTPNGHPRPGQPGPTVEQIDAQAAGLTLRLTILRDRITRIEGFVTTAKGEAGADARSVMGQAFIGALADVATSFSEEMKIEYNIISKNVEQLQTMRAQVASNIVVPHFGIPRQ